MLPLSLSPSPYLRSLSLSFAAPAVSVNVRPLGASKVCHVLQQISVIKEKNKIKYRNLNALHT